MTDLPHDAEPPESRGAADEPAPPAGDAPSAESGESSATRSALVGAKTGFVIGALLWPVIMVVALKPDRLGQEAPETSGRFAFAPLVGGSFMAGMVGALAGCFGGLARQSVAGALVGAATAYYCCFPWIAPMRIGGYAVLAVLVTMVAFNATCGACGAVAARSWVKPEGTRGTLQFSIGDLLILTSLLATLVGCVAYLVQQ